MSSKSGYINWLGDLKREFHHVKTVGGDDDAGRPKYEPAMTLLKDKLLGRSFFLRLSDFWRYCEPEKNLDARGWDWDQFGKMVERLIFKCNFGLMSPEEKQDTLICIGLAERFSNDTGFMLTVSWDLVNCCKMLDIPVSTESLCQLFNFIQDGLSQLRTMPLHIPEDHQEIGEIKITLNDKTTVQSLTLSETDMKVGAR